MRKIVIVAALITIFSVVGISQGLEEGWFIVAGNVTALADHSLSSNEGNMGSSAEFVGKTVFHRRLRRPRCSPSLKASLASSAAAPALTLGCAPRCRLVWAMGNGASGGGSGHRV